MKQNKAKFFCENCGSEVPENARVCKACGKFFISVRCPKCGATGSNSEFQDGCPECGYAVSSPNKSSNIKYKSKNGSKIRKNNSFEYAKSNKNVDNSLPSWIYLLTGVLFLIVLFAVYSCCMK